MLRNPLRTYSSNSQFHTISNILVLKKVLNILDSDCQNAILYTKLLIQYTVLTSVFSHKIHLIKFYLYIVYYWSMELRVIAEGLTSSVHLYGSDTPTVPPHAAILRLKVQRWRYQGCTRALWKPGSPLGLGVDIIALMQVCEQVSWAESPPLQLLQLKYSKTFQVVTVPGQTLPGEPSGTRMVGGNWEVRYQNNAEGQPGTTSSAVQP